MQIDLFEDDKAEDRRTPYGLPPLSPLSPGAVGHEDQGTCFGFCVSGEFRCPPCGVAQPDTGKPPKICQNIGGDNGL